MTVRDYLHQPHHLRYVVAATVAPEGPDRELTAIMTSAHQTLAAAKEAIRWDRDEVHRMSDDQNPAIDLIIVDLESLHV